MALKALAKTETTYIDNTAANAFVDATTSLAAYAGTDAGSTPYYIRMIDAAGKTAKGYLGAAGAGETVSEKLTNGDFESWITATNATAWTEYVSGTSTINREASDVHGGTYAARLDIDASNSDAYFFRDSLVLVASGLYRLSFWYKNSASGKTSRFVLANNSSSVSLKSDGTWTSGTIYLTLPNVTSWTQVSITFNAYPSGGNSHTLLFRTLSAASSSIYFDDISLVRITDPDSTGLHVMSAFNGTDRGYESMEAGFDPITIASYKVYQKETWADIANKHTNTPVTFASIAFNSGTRYYGTDWVRADSRTYKGNILSVPMISASIGDEERTYEKDRVSIIFNDTDYEFRTLETTETVGFGGLTVTIWMAFQEDHFDQKKTLYTGKVESWRRLDNLRYEFIVTADQSWLDDVYPDKIVTLTDWPNADPTAVGVTIPILFGSIDSSTTTNDGAFGHPALAESSGLPLVDTTTDAVVHLVGYEALNGKYYSPAFCRVYLDGVLKTNAVDYTWASVVESDGKRYYKITWAAGTNPTAVNKVSVDLIHSIWDNYPIDWMTLVLENYFNAPVTTSTAAYIAAHALEVARGYDGTAASPYHSYFGGAIWEQKTLRQIFDDWKAEWNYDIYFDKSGEVCPIYLSVSTGISAAYTDVNHILTGWQSTLRPETMVNYYRMGYNYHYSKNYYQNYITDEDTASQTKYGRTSSEYGGYMWVRDATTAADLTARKLLRTKDPLVFDKFRLPLCAYSRELTDVISITHYLGDGAVGYNPRYFQVRKIDMDPDHMTVDITGEDVRNYIGKACVLGDENLIGANWGAASDADKYYCYLCDETDNLFSNDIDEGKRLVD